jgi:hypothetical protein
MNHAENRNRTISGGHAMQNLTQLTRQVKQEYTTLRSYVVSSQQIRLTESGYLSTGKNEYLITRDGLDECAQKGRIPTQFFRRLPPDMRAVLFNRCFEIAISDNEIPREMRVNLNSDNHVVGFEKSDLLRISPEQLMEVVHSSLPNNLRPEEVGVGRFVASHKSLHLSCFSPEIISEPRPGDVINGGIDVVHHLTGDEGTQVSCYLRRLVCSNGAIAHVCGEDKHLRARRLSSGRFDQADMLNQIRRLLQEAWAQLQEKLDAVKGLLQMERLPMDFLRHQRTRFSLSNSILRAIEHALREDELGSTNTQYDVFNAISRVASHEEDLTFRQQRTLSRMAGEFSQQTVHKCDKCGQWVVQEVEN